LPALNQSSVVKLVNMAARPGNQQHIDQLGDEIDTRELATLVWLDILDQPTHPLYGSAVSHVRMRFLHFHIKPASATSVFLKLAAGTTRDVGSLCSFPYADRDPPGKSC
jgi:hypothetical protein